MNKGKNALIVLLAVSGLGLVTLKPTTALAQTRSVTQKNIQIKFDHLDVRDAIKHLCKSVGVRYSIDSSVLGIISIDLKNVSFLEGLAAIAKQVDAHYNVEKGIYKISHDPIHTIKINNDPSFIVFGRSEGKRIVVQDQQNLYLVDDEVITKLSKADMNTKRTSLLIKESKGAIDPKQPTISVRDALRMIFKRAGVSYSISPEVSGVVNTPGENSFEFDLQRTLNQSGTTYRIEAGIYQVVNRSQQSEYPTHERQVTQDDQNVYIIDHDHVLKIRKSDLKLLAVANWFPQ